MAVTIHLLKATGRLAPFEDTIRSALSEGLAKVEAKLKLPELDIVVSDNPELAIPETGVGGGAPSAHLLHIDIDPTHPGLAMFLNDELQSTLAHELHHCVRWGRVGYGNSLLEACISEGLADHFDQEVNGGPPKPWSVAVRGGALDSLIADAREVFDLPYDQHEWFWGAKDKPRWAAYTIGYALVGVHMEKSGKTSAELVSTPAKKFVA